MSDDRPRTPISTSLAMEALGRALATSIGAILARLVVNGRMPADEAVELLEHAAACVDGMLPAFGDDRAAVPLSLVSEPLRGAADVIRHGGPPPLRLVD